MSLIKRILVASYRATTSLLSPRHQVKADFILSNKYVPNFNPPRTFSEKVVARKLNWSDGRYTLLSDKIAVREYVSELLGNEVLTEIYGVYEKAENINFSDLPQRFVLKCNHDSGSAQVILNKKEANLEELVNYFRHRLNRKIPRRLQEEWYWKIVPKVFAEEYLGDDEGVPLPDYKFFVFNGRAQMIHMIYGRHKDIRANLYTANWEPIDGLLGYAPNGPFIDPPPTLGAMRKAAERLGAGFDFVRVDFYTLPERPVIFGELTFAPDSGYGHFRPKSIDDWLGGFWDYSD